MHSKQYPLSDPLFRFKSTLILRIHRLSSGSFDFYNKLLPAISFCTNYENMSHGKNSEDLIKILSIQNILKELSIGSEDRMERDLKNDSLDTIIESISLRHNCFTINSQLRSKKFEIFSFFVQ